MSRNLQRFRGFSSSAPPPAGHQHEVESHSEPLNLGWCRCGQEFRDGRWRAPRTAEGRTRRQRMTGVEEG